MTGPQALSATASRSPTNHGGTASSAATKKPTPTVWSEDVLEARWGADQQTVGREADTVNVPWWFWLLLAAGLALVILVAESEER